MTWGLLKQALALLVNLVAMVLLIATAIAVDYSSVLVVAFGVLCVLAACGAALASAAGSYRIWLVVRENHSTGRSAPRP